MINISKIETSGSIGGSIDNLTDRQKEIRNDFGMISERIRNDFGKEVAQTFDIICKNPDLTAKEISQLINKTPRTVENYTAKLKDAGIIERKGAKLGGYWKIIEK